jgi:hypothetical protein
MAKKKKAVKKGASTKGMMMPAKDMPMKKKAC